MAGTRGGSIQDRRPQLLDGAPARQRNHHRSRRVSAPTHSSVEPQLQDRDLPAEAGFATELARAAYSAASSVDPEMPFIAWVAAHNAPSRKVAERLGLTNHGLGVDPSDGQHRLAYADRPVSDLGLATTKAAD